MKKIFTFVVVAAAALTATSCGSLGSRGVDTLSYAVGADLGMNLNFGMADFNLNRDIVIENIKEFYANGDMEGEAIKETRTKMMQFQYTRFMPYMRAKRMQEMIQTDCPDTLPELPALYDEEFTMEGVSEMMGTNMGAAIKSIGEELNMRDLMRGMNEALALENAEVADSLLLMSQEQMRNFFQRFSERKQREAEEKREQEMKENARLSIEWLTDVEKEEGVQRTESGLLYRIERAGSEVKATEDTDKVLVHYEGTTREGKVFDSSYERNEPISFALNRVIKGWTEGMKLVGVGGEITLWIPAELAYGERGAGSDIGPNEALKFKVELLEVNPAE